MRIARTERVSVITSPAPSRTTNFTYERYEGDGLDYIPLKAFREDPEANPIATTVSGKMEIYCQDAVDRVHECGWSEIPPLPKYMPAIEGYEETYSNWETGEKGEYPFQIVGLHIPRHSFCKRWW